MGFAMFSLDIPTTKTSSSLLCLSKDEVSKVEPSACINCGRCVEACPEQLIPSRLAKFSNNGLAEAFRNLARTRVCGVRKLQFCMPCTQTARTVH